MDEKKEYLPVKDYALKKELTLDAVYKRIKRGTITIKKIGSYTLVLND